MMTTPSRPVGPRRPGADEFDDELREIKREIVESRGLIIKTNNLTNALAADLKSISKRQLGFEWRAVPFTRNTGGFDNHGGGPDADFPNLEVNSDDRDLKLNQMLSVSWNFYVPFDFQVSE